MNYTPSPLLRSMALFAWHQTGYLVDALFKGFGLARTGCRPFLLRPVRARLAADLARFEPLIRRILFLMALEKGALPPRIVTASTARQTALPAPRYLRTPRFRLTEAPARQGHGKPPSRAAANGPRIRFLDMPTPPPGPFDYPPSSADLVPARPLIQRLRALNDVFENAEFYITAMRRLIGQPQAPALFRTKVPPAFRSRSVSKLYQETLYGLHDEAACLQARLNSS